MSSLAELFLLHKASVTPKLKFWRLNLVRLTYHHFLSVYVIIIPCSKLIVLDKISMINSLDILSYICIIISIKHIAVISFQIRNEFIFFLKQKIIIWHFQNRWWIVCIIVCYGTYRKILLKFSITLFYMYCLVRKLHYFCTCIVIFS